MYGYSIDPNPDLNADPLMGFTMGNLGGAVNTCRIRKSKVGEMGLHCHSGNILIDDRTQIGMMSSDVGQKIHCTEQSIVEEINHSDQKDITNCTQKLDRNSLMETLKQDCDGKKHCKLNINLTSLPWLENYDTPKAADQCGD
jgi:hypothetical protein